MNETRLQRIFEIIPGAIVWFTFIFFVLLSIFNPLLAALLIIAYDLYWVMRAAYLTILLIIGHRHLEKEKGRNWLKECKKIKKGEFSWDNIYHVVIFPIYKEGADILTSSFDALCDANYPKEKIIPVLAVEE